jgi:cholesterol transport system auxiliary component
VKSSSIRAWLVPLACSWLAACALFSKAEPLVPRYFTPEDSVVAATAAQNAGPTDGSDPRRLRLGSVRGGSHLRERIMFRQTTHELAYYEDRRWTERPEAYLRRALARALFEERGLARVVSGSVATLEAELVAFEEIRAPTHTVRVQVIVTLSDDRVVRLQQTFTAEQPVQNARSSGQRDDADAVVDALANALHQCVAQIADAVVAKLGDGLGDAPVVAPARPAAQP